MKLINKGEKIHFKMEMTREEKEAFHTASQLFLQLAASVEDANKDTVEICGSTLSTQQLKEASGMCMCMYLEYEGLASKAENGEEEIK